MKFKPGDRVDHAFFDFEEGQGTPGTVTSADDYGEGPMYEVKWDDGFE